ncbi:MAG TPA: VWA domain-containing protein, partial [Vulgatibacter sp.]
MALGGIPAQLVFRRRKPQRPDVVVLCDVSDSVRDVSRMMLLFVHTLQSMFARVRTFAFVSDVGEITSHFKDVDASRAVDLAVAGQAINVYANSNYGRAFALFVGAHLGAVTRRTTVLVIGDGRNNYNPANVWALEELKRRARRVVWICSEDRSSWALGDSEMPLFEKAVDQVIVVRNMEDLEAVAREIVLT